MCGGMVPEGQRPDSENEDGMFARNRKLPYPPDDYCSSCPVGWDWVDRKIYHDNGHVWPGFAGEPDGGNYGGSDF